MDNESEIHFLQRVRHPRLVMFIGAGRMNDDNLFLVLEFMEKGSMRKIIDEDGKKFPWISRIRILLDVTLGMSYLHGEHNSIHRDLKSQNVLLTIQKGMRTSVILSNYALEHTHTSHRHTERKSS